MKELSELPPFLTPDEVGELIRKTRTAIYAMNARGQLPGVTKVGSRLLFRRDALLHWLNQKRTSSPKE